MVLGGSIVTYARRKARAFSGGKPYMALENKENEFEAESPQRLEKIPKEGDKNKRKEEGTPKKDVHLHEDQECHVDSENRRLSWIGRSLSYSSTRATANKNGKAQSKRGRPGYNRKAIPTLSEKKKEEYNHYVKDMKAYFSEVDSYELLVESPSKQEHLPTESIEFGLCGRRSSVATGRRRSSIVIPRHSIPEYVPQNRKSLAPPKMEIFPEEEEVEDADDVCERQSLMQDFGTIDTEEDLDLSVETQLTTIAEADDVEHKLTHANADDMSPQERLLNECGQTLDTDSIPDMESFLSSEFNLDQVKKIGEGTFGEAFKVDNLVLKIVPIDGEVLVNGEKQKCSEELYAEVVIHNCLQKLRDCTNISNTCSAFIETYAVKICKGKYAETLVHEWEVWDSKHKSENDHVGIFPESQMYTVFVYADGGTDLEQFQFISFDEVRSMLLQVTLGLAVAEEACKFEHRDLHWGNLLLKRSCESRVNYTLRDVEMAVDTCGLGIQIIDFTLSRLETDQGYIAFCDLSAEPELFNGPKYDIQADTYRRMKKATGGSWPNFTPKTNVLWIYYLTDLVLNQKEFPCSAEEKHLLRQFRKNCMRCNCSADLVCDEFFKDSWRVV